MFRKIIDFFKDILGKKKVLQIEAPIKDIKKQNNRDLFNEQLKNVDIEKIRLMNIQEKLKNGELREESLEKEDVILLKKIYCEQILNLVNSINDYI